MNGRSRSPVSPISRVDHSVRRRHRQQHRHYPASNSRRSSRSPPPGVATIIKNIGGVNVTLSRKLESIPEHQLVAEANNAIHRLQTENGPTGLVIVTSFSHTAVIADVQGATDDKFKQKLALVEAVAMGKPVIYEPESVGVSLKKVACFSIPSNLNLHKLNIAGIGAKSFVSPVYIKKIVDEIIKQQQQQPQGSNITPEIIADKIIRDIKDILEPLFKVEADKDFKPCIDYGLNQIRKLIKSEVKKASKRNPTVLTFQHLSNAAQNRVVDSTAYTPLVNTIAYQFHADNLQSSSAFTILRESGTCMMNKEYLRQNKLEEHEPPIPSDWHINVFDKNGNLLLGNTSNTDPSYMMDLITLVKILKQTDKVTTKDILDLLYEKGIRNVVFIDGGCNVFCGDGGMLACSNCHSSLDTVCNTCSTPIRSHPWGGMKNKKTKPTKKRARTVRTVRRGRRMRKGYKRYKTYKR
jgi:hypothetical protein